MTKLDWGLLGPEQLNNERRSRTLGVGAAIRSFNELAVPGLGGIRFGKQVFLALLGIKVAEECNGKYRNIEIANSVEALSCLISFRQNGWMNDTRVRGINKLRHKTDLSFKAMRKREFYVTQPMRMATVQALPALGLVSTEGSRFNTFKMNNTGNQFIEEFCYGYEPCYHRQGIVEYLKDWALGFRHDVTSNDNLKLALSTLIPMTINAATALEERLVQGGQNEEVNAKQRRRAALNWVEMLRKNKKQPITWNDCPSPIEKEHWLDLEAGALFVLARDSAFPVLDSIESQIRNKSKRQFSFKDDQLTSEMKAQISSLRDHCNSYLDFQRDSIDENARSFCLDCTESDEIAIIRNIVKRDDTTLRIRDDLILPGPAFEENVTNETDENSSNDELENDSVIGIQWPAGMSPRVANLFLLNLDLHGELSTWLSKAQRRDQ